MSSTRENQDAARRLREEARAWHVRLNSDAAEESDWLAFEDWIAADAAHLAAYEAVEAVWLELDDLGEQPAVTPEADNVVAFRPRAAPAPRRPPLWLGGAVAASLAAVVAVGVVIPREPPTQTYSTPKGERRVVALDDGTHITLNGGSSLSVQLGKRERRVRMDEAEAVFDVAKDASRPFLIDVGDRQVRVVGTEFDVLRHQGLIKVVVRRGVVEVRPAGQPTAKPLARLTHGQALSHAEGKAADTVTLTDPDMALAWTTGRLVFQGERLDQVAATLNRYVDRPIAVAPDAAALPVTAVIELGSEAQMLSTLEAFLPVRAQTSGAANSVRLSLRR